MPGPLSVTSISTFASHVRSESATSGASLGASVIGGAPPPEPRVRAGQARAALRQQSLPVRVELPIRAAHELVVGGRHPARPERARAVASVACLRAMDDGAGATRRGERPASHSMGTAPEFPCVAPLRWADRLPPHHLDSRRPVPQHERRPVTGPVPHRHSPAPNRNAREQS